MKHKSGRDRVFSRRLSKVKAFEFDDNVAQVFQDMISRSVPGYPLLLHLIGLYSDIFVQPGSRVYDLGCSLGDATQIIARQCSDIDCEIIAVDNSPSMIEKCMQHDFAGQSVTWCCEDIMQTEIANASMVVLNLTLQFISPADRPAMLRKIFRGLVPGAVLILSEKVLFDDPGENERMIQLHQAFKKTRGYSDLEISQKRSSLENVLIPDRDRSHIDGLLKIGFAEVYQCFRCFNFASYLAIKS